GLRSLYSTNLLRLLMGQKSSGFLAITLADFRHAMEIPDSYRMADINRRVIGTATKELKEKADLEIECTATKRGGSVHSLRFEFKTVAQSRLPGV
ncbi:MAG: replication initiation protein, partial [Betaproteobacteria bacterium]|nr:replication initiation protein [Betaproteobacteria bacterium]